MSLPALRCGLLLAVCLVLASAQYKRTAPPYVDDFIVQNPFSVSQADFIDPTMGSGSRDQASRPDATFAFGALDMNITDLPNDFNGQFRGSMQYNTRVFPPRPGDYGELRISSANTATGTLNLHYPSFDGIASETVNVLANGADSMLIGACTLDINEIQVTAIVFSFIGGQVDITSATLASSDLALDCSANLLEEPDQIQFLALVAVPTAGEYYNVDAISMRFSINGAQTDGTFRPMCWGTNLRGRVDVQDNGDGTFTVVHNLSLGTSVAANMPDALNVVFNPYYRLENGTIALRATNVQTSRGNVVPFPVQEIPMLSPDIIAIENAGAVFIDSIGPGEEVTITYDLEVTGSGCVTGLGAFTTEFQQRLVGLAEGQNGAGMRGLDVAPGESILAFTNDGEYLQGVERCQPPLPPQLCVIQPPTDPPTAPPTTAPPTTEAPTPAPTAPPTEAPTNPPTDAPTAPPTDAPTAPPTTAPPTTEAPTPAPTAPPTEAPTNPPPSDQPDHMCVVPKFDQATGACTCMTFPCEPLADGSGGYRCLTDEWYCVPVWRTGGWPENPSFYRASWNAVTDQVCECPVFV